MILTVVGLDLILQGGPVPCERCAGNGKYKQYPISMESGKVYCDLNCMHFHFSDSY